MSTSKTTYKDFYQEEMKSSIKAETKKHLSEKYAVVLLDKESKHKLIEKFSDIIPEGWEIKCHHMTIDPYKEISDGIDKSVTLMVSSIGILPDKAIAVKVVGYKGKTNNSFPHVTIAINEKGGAGSKDSNEIKEWRPITENIVLTGIVKNIEKGTPIHGLSESPLKTYTTLGFDRNDKGGFKNKSFGNDVDRKLVTDPNSVKKVAKIFSHSNANIDLYFVNKKGIREFEEYGKVGSMDLIFNEVPNGLGIKPEQLKNGEINDDAITVFYIGNYGFEKVPLTPWVIAHRFGHALRARGKNETWDYMFNTWFPSEIKMIFKEYGIPWDKKSYYSDPSELHNFYNLIGTMRSARENKITRPAEFNYELFAQYLSTGKIKLNRLPRNLHLGYSAFGRKKYYTAKDIDFVNEMIQRIENTFPFYANDVLNAAIGDVFIM